MQEEILSGNSNAQEALAESRTIDSRRDLRHQLAADVNAFLSGGGKINEIEPNITADPPKKPTNNYGSRAI
ncbi:MAG: hypothetical protein COC19_01275 [SAR86 cluster bacterium]|uniref:Transcriptional regulator SutA RNAP-binding domain-containing protein n=1 Tax=SAR86 cluster bacterium TaxID=2030880 RepID=A0A2A4MT06_9GAMM|nr:MAG: hypothetical protein COC19_01275 [SAR86 cluster bacterium]